MKTVIIIPTYNERENIKILIPGLEKIFRKIRNHDMSILVADDNSPDGTSEAVKRLMKKYSNIYLIRGRKEGLGAAYLRGFQYAIENLKAEVLFEMDADLSHPPKLIPVMMKMIDNGYDLVIGSRYIKGGGTPDWNLTRRLISKGGNFFARIISGMYSICDCTSGLRAIRSSSLKRIDRKHINTHGYAFQSTLLYELIGIGAKVKEVPLIFYDRKLGETKLQAKDLIEFFFNSLRIRFKSSERMITFLLIGASGILINLGLFMVSKRLIFNYTGQSIAALLLASLIGDIISILYNFFLNNLLTYNRMLKKGALLKFYIISIPTILVNNVVLFALSLGFGVGVIFSKLVGILAAFIWNYLFNIKYIWREKIE